MKISFSCLAARGIFVGPDLELVAACTSRSLWAGGKLKCVALHDHVVQVLYYMSTYIRESKAWLPEGISGFVSSFRAFKDAGLILWAHSHSV